MASNVASTSGRSANSCSRRTWTARCPCTASFTTATRSGGTRLSVEAERLVHLRLAEARAGDTVEGVQPPVEYGCGEAVSRRLHIGESAPAPAPGIERPRRRGHEAAALLPVPLVAATGDDEAARVGGALEAAERERQCRQRLPTARARVVALDRLHRSVVVVASA